MEEFRGWERAKCTIHFPDADLREAVNEDAAQALADRRILDVDEWKGAACACPLSLREVSHTLETICSFRGPYVSHRETYLVTPFGVARHPPATLCRTQPTARDSREAESVPEVGAPGY